MNSYPFLRVYNTGRGDENLVRRGDIMLFKARRFTFLWLPLVLIMLIGKGCGSDSGGGGAISPPYAPSVTASALGFRQIQLEWDFVPLTAHYRVLTSPDGFSGFTVLPEAAQVLDLKHSFELQSIHKYGWGNTQYIVEACNSNNTLIQSSLAYSLPQALSSATTGYTKASLPDEYDRFGSAIALSADGNTLAIGSSGEDSSAVGIDGDASDNSANAAGAVYVYVRSGETWTQQAYIKASDTSPSDDFGCSVALSADGSTLAVGAQYKDGTDPWGGPRLNSGGVYVFSRSGTTWSQQAFLDDFLSDSCVDDRLGFSLALSADGNTIAAGAPFFRDPLPFVGFEDDGYVCVFHRSGTTWSKEARLDGSSADTQFGAAVALTADGNTLAVGACEVNAVYVFGRSGATWSEETHFSASSTESDDSFGRSVALSNDGNTMAIGAYLEDSNATRINGDETDNSASNSGAVYIYVRSGANWIQEAYLKASNTEADDYFGFPLTLSADGNELLVGSQGEDSSATGVGGNELDNSASQSGAAYLFSRLGTNWRQDVYLKASNTETGDGFGCSIAYSANEDDLFIGALNEASSTSFFQTDNQAPGAGAVYLY